MPKSSSPAAHTADVHAVAAGHVVVATRGDVTADAAVRVASAYAARQHLSIDIVAALTPLPPEMTARAVGFTDLDALCREALKSTVDAQLVRTSGSAIPVTVTGGYPAEMIADHAVAHGASLVVMGGRHHDRLPRLFGVEVAISVHRKIAAPVLTVAPNASERMATIVIGTDFSPEARRAAELAMAFAADGAAVHVVHAWPWTDLSGSGQDVWSTVYDAGVTELFEELREALPLPPRARVTTHSVRGDAAKAIGDIAQAQYADLIAVGTHRRGLADRLTIGSTAEAIMRSATCSVLIVP